jgi:hypothetical protein
VRVGIIRLELYYPAQAGHRFVELPLAVERNAQVAARLGIVRFQSERPPEAGNCLVQLPLVLEHKTQVVVRFSVVGFLLQCFCHVFDGDTWLAHHARKHAEKMERVRVIRFDLKNLPIDLLGSLEPAAVMVRERKRYSFRNGRQINLKAISDLRFQI